MSEATMDWLIAVLKKRKAGVHVHWGLTRSVAEWHDMEEAG